MLKLIPLYGSESLSLYVRTKLSVDRLDRTFAQFPNVSNAVTCECPKSDSITSMTEAFFGLKPGTLSSNINSRKLTIEDQECKWGDERHREGDEGSDDESSEEADVTEY